MIDQSIYSEVVIDSTHAANYDAWQTNAFGSGFDVLVLLSNYSDIIIPIYSFLRM